MQPPNDDYDEKCYQLADHFFADEPEFATEEHIAMLAYLIQQVVEDYFHELKNPPPHPVRSV